MSDNPLIKQQSLEDLAKHCVAQCEYPDADVFNTVLTACFQAKALGIDECINAVDCMLNSNTQYLNSHEKNMLIQTLNNLRLSYAYKRESIIKTYESD